MVYQDHLTKFVFLRPLTSKRAEEVAYNLVDIFTIIGAPSILQSDNRREFVNKVIQNITSFWPELKIVHGKPRHSQSQGSVECANQDIENMLTTWMADNKTDKWSEELRFIQFMKNQTYHRGIQQSRYEAMFGCPGKMGLASSNIPYEILSLMNSEEDLNRALDEIAGHASVDQTNDEIANPHVQSNVTHPDIDAWEELPDENLLPYTTDLVAEEETQLQENNSSYDSDSQSSSCSSSYSSAEEDLQTVHLETRMCYICKDVSSEGFTMCKICGQCVDETCSFMDISHEGLLCLLCKKKTRIEGARSKSFAGLEKQAKKMKFTSEKQFLPIAVGETVMVKVPEVDRSKADAKNIIAIVDGMYKLGTEKGRIAALYTRNQILACKQKFLSFDSVPDKEISFVTVSCNCYVPWIRSGFLSMWL